MTAEVRETDPRYAGYCPECMYGSGDCNSEEETQDWADDHNRENHR